MTAEVKTYVSTYVSRCGEISGKSWDSVTLFSEGIAVAFSGNRYCILGRNLEDIFIVENKDITSIDPPKSGLLLATNTGRKYGFIRSSGETVHPFEFDYATQFEGRFSLASKGGCSLLLGKDGDVHDIANICSDIVHVSLSEKYLVAQTKDGKSHVYDHDLNLRFSSPLAIGAFNGGEYATFTIGGKSGMIDDRGQIVVGAAYDVVTSVSDGAFLTYSSRSSFWTLRNIKGEQITGLKIVDHAPISEGVCFLIADRRRMAVSVSDGEVLWSDDYFGSLAQFRSRMARCDNRTFIRFFGRSFTEAFSFPKALCSYAGHFDDLSDYCPVDIHVSLSK